MAAQAQVERAEAEILPALRAAAASFPARLVQGRAPLMRSRMCFQCGVGRVFVAAEHHVVPDRIGASGHRVRRLRGPRIGMYAHLAKISAEARLKEGPALRIEWLTRRAQRLMNAGGRLTGRGPRPLLLTAPVTAPSPLRRLHRKRLVRTGARHPAATNRRSDSCELAPMTGLAPAPGTAADGPPPAVCALALTVPADIRPAAAAAAMARNVRIDRRTISSLSIAPRRRYRRHLRKREPPPAHRDPLRPDDPALNAYFKLIQTFFDGTERSACAPNQLT